MVVQIQDNILKNVQAVFPKNLASELTNPIERITQQVTDFIRGNPLVSTAVVGIGTTGLIASATSLFRKRRKKAKVKKKRKKVSGRRVRVKRRGKKKSAAQIRRVRLRNLAKARRAKRTGKRKTHSSPRHKGHKRVSFTTASGKKVNFLVGRKKHKRRKR